MEESNGRPENFAVGKSWKETVEKLLSKQLAMENFASYFYLYAYGFCNRRGIACPKIAKFFHKQHLEELEHAKGIIDYMNKLKFKVTYEPIALTEEAGNLVELFNLAYKYEMMTYENILSINKQAEEAKDYSLTQFLESYIEEQVNSVKEFSDYLTDAKRCQDGLGIFLFNKNFD